MASQTVMVAVGWDGRWVCLPRVMDVEQAAVSSMIQKSGGGRVGMVGGWVA